ncbi:MAG: terpene cyclase/mutase family protein [Goleter apudmare HA4340-LM2]|nr:terpene cyclase/mutase family protein [Goleter apudmare HA4340-LM2]
MLSNLKIPESLKLFESFSDRAIKDVLFKSSSIFEVQEHLAAAIEWLKLAHDRSPDDGVSWGYSLKGGWRKSYRETSGYIAETFFDIAKFNQDDDAWQRTIAICKWLVEVQNDDGSISDPRYGSGGIVFDTGQVLQGLIRAYEETQDPDFLQAAEAAGDWLVRVADATGRWTKNTHLGVPHVYNTRVAWQLLKLHTISPQVDRERVGRANLDWAVSQQQDGWFNECAFRPGDAPFTHNIAYAIRGLWEAGYLLNEQKYINAATAGSEVMIPHIAADGFIPGQFDHKGKPQGNYCCLTGNCQMAIIWLKLFQQTGDRIYYESAKSSLQYVMSTQDIQTPDPNIRGGIKGSQPIWGEYTRLSYPNWATKFFIDGLLLLLKSST